MQRNFSCQNFIGRKRKTLCSAHILWKK